MILTITECWVCLQEAFSNAELNTQVLSWVAPQLPTSTPASSCTGQSRGSSWLCLLSGWESTCHHSGLFYVGSGESQPGSHAWHGWNSSYMKVSREFPSEVWSRPLVQLALWRRSLGRLEGLLGQGTIASAIIRSEIKLLVWMNSSHLHKITFTQCKQGKLSRQPCVFCQAQGWISVSKDAENAEH